MSALPSQPTNSSSEKQINLYEIDLQRIDGTIESMAKYEGNWTLVVNVASKCGFTPQYEGLETLFQTFRERGLVILGFPCNQFLKQEPAENLEIAKFCSTRYQVTFPMFAKIDVNGPNTHPLYQALKKQARSWLGLNRIGWNFTKFLIYPHSSKIERFSPTTTPDAIGERLAKLIG